MYWEESSTIEDITNEYLLWCEKWEVDGFDRKSMDSDQLEIMQLCDAKFFKNIR